MDRQELKNKTFRISRWLGEARIVYDKNEQVDSMTHHSEPVSTGEALNVWPRYEFDDAAFGRLVQEFPEGTEIKIGVKGLATYVEGPNHGNGTFELVSGDDLKEVVLRAGIMFIEGGYKPRTR